jgi:hypothetical protein
MLACPYCYNKFTEKEILFRCTGRPGPEGDECKPARDDNLVRWLGISTPLPPCFDADGRRLTARCPHCHGDSPYRVCPFCRSRLPVDFGKVDSRLIAMIGAKQSGKTVFMTVLIHELMYRIGRDLDLAIMGADEATIRSFGTDYESRLYRDHALPEGVRAAAMLRQPLVFDLAMERPRRLASPREQRTILSFFDTAGEDLNSTESVELNARYLSSADAIILLLDPLQMPGARSQALTGTVLPDPGQPGFDSPYNVLTRVTQLLRGARPERTRLHPVGRVRPSARIQTPMAVAFAKLDSLEHTFPRNSPLTSNSEPRRQFDLQDSVAVHRQVQALMDEWDGPKIDQLMQHNYERFRYFGLSALGTLPTSTNTVSQIQPHRVHDPFLWLLSEFGIIPATRG